MPRKERSEHYSETNAAVSLDDIEALAREVDQINKTEPEPEKKRRTGSGRKERPEGPIEPDEVIPPDPEFIAMVQHGANLGVDFMKEQLRLMEPGMTTRQKLGLCCGRLAQKLAPVGTDTVASNLACIFGYLAFWVLIGRMPPERKVTNEPAAIAGANHPIDGHHG